MTRRRRALAQLLALCLLFALLPTAVGGAEKRRPTLFVADEVWYKDVSEPLLLQDGTYYLPLGAVALLPSVTLREDTAIGAVLLTRDDRTLSFDTATGVRILPDGDRTLSLCRANGTLYLPLSDVLGLLGVGFELHTYQSGAVAVRINDGSGLFPFSSLLRMYAAEETPPTRAVAPAAPVHSGLSFRFAEEYDTIAAISSVSPGTILLLNAETLLTYSDSSSELMSRAFFAHLCRLFGEGAVPALYSDDENPVYALHDLSLANNRLFEQLHRSALYYLSPINLTAEEQALYDNAGWIRLTNIPLPARTAK